VAAAAQCLCDRTGTAEAWQKRLTAFAGEG
jgi:hypothetical protein